MTEKNYNPKQKEKKSMKKAEAADKMKKNIIKDIEKGGKVPEKVAKKEEKMAEQVEEKLENKAEKEVSEKAEPKKEKKTVQKKEPVRKDLAVVNSYNIPISTKKAADICRFIKGKTIETAMKELELVNKMKKAVPMKGEIPHRKGKIMSGGFPKNASRQFIILLKSLAGNSNVNGIDDPVVVEAIANIASRPYGRFGRWRRKRTHVKLVARNKKKKEAKK
jgi:ribosomal protein L22